MKSIRVFTALFVLLASACTGVPKGITPVSNFELTPYLGTWYEIARLDHSFERGLSNVTAQYTLRDDGGVVVKNRGYQDSKARWKEATGKAYFKGASDVGHLKVSFFGPFYGSYVVFELDSENYSYAFVTSYNKESLWFLSREPEVSDAQYQRFIEQADALGFEVSEIMRVEHNRQ
ncbi:MAG: lipocalin family protein [Pseudomonadota bacterium]